MLSVDTVSQCCQLLSPHSASLVDAFVTCCSTNIFICIFFSFISPRQLVCQLPLWFLKEVWLSPETNSTSDEKQAIALGSSNLRAELGTSYVTELFSIRRIILVWELVLMPVIMLHINYQKGSLVEGSTVLWPSWLMKLQGHHNDEHTRDDLISGILLTYTCMLYKDRKRLFAYPWPWGQYWWPVIFYTHPHNEHASDDSVSGMYGNQYIYVTSSWRFLRMYLSFF